MVRNTPWPPWHSGICSNPASGASRKANRQYLLDIVVVTAEPVTRPDDDSRPFFTASHTVLESKLGPAIVLIVNYNVESTMTS
jgi:hypothetical protein